MLNTDMTGPNGIAFSPDEAYLYVGNWDDKKKVVMRYPVNADGTLGVGEVFLAWGDTDGKTLYLTAQSGLYKMRLNAPWMRSK